MRALTFQVPRRNPKPAAYVETPPVIQTGKRRAATASTNAHTTRSRASVDNDTRVSSRQTKGQKRDWRESSVAYDESNKASYGGASQVNISALIFRRRRKR
jgi:hypothetical protein